MPKLYEIWTTYCYLELLIWLLVNIYTNWQVALLTEFKLDKRKQDNETKQINTKKQATLTGTWG